MKFDFTVSMGFSDIGATELIYRISELQLEPVRTLISSEQASKNQMNTETHLFFGR